MHHSDRGSQYTSIDYTETLADHGVLACVGSVGDAYDNALPESFIDSFKTELIADRAPRRPRSRATDRSPCSHRSPHIAPSRLGLSANAPANRNSTLWHYGDQDSPALSARPTHETGNHKPGLRETQPGSRHPMIAVSAE